MRRRLLSVLIFLVLLPAWAEEQNPSLQNDSGRMVSYTLDLSGENAPSVPKLGFGDKTHGDGNLGGEIILIPQGTKAVNSQDFYVWWECWTGTGFTLTISIEPLQYMGTDRDLSDIGWSLIGKDSNGAESIDKLTDGESLISIDTSNSSQEFFRCTIENFGQIKGEQLLGIETDSLIGVPAGTAPYQGSITVTYMEG